MKAGARKSDDGNAGFDGRTTDASRRIAGFGAAVALLFSVFRCYHLSSAFLPQIDEISLLNQAGVPFLSGGTFSSSWFPLSLLTKIAVPAGIGLTALRLLTVFCHAAAGVVFYFVLKERINGSSALAFLLLCSVHWYFNYTGRLFDVSSYTPLYFAIHAYFLSLWFIRKDGAPLAAAFFAAGLGLDNYPAPWLYYLPFCLIVVAKELSGGRGTKSATAGAAACFFLASAPLVYVLFHADAEGNWSYLSHFSRTNHDLFPSLYNPGPFFRTLVETFTFHAAAEPGAGRLAAGILLSAWPLVFFLFRNPLSSFDRFLVLGYFFQIAEIALSPVVPNHSGHFTIVLLFYFGLIVRPCAGLLSPFNLAAAGVVLYFGAQDFVARFVFQDQGRLATTALAEIQGASGELGQWRSVLLSDGARLKFDWLGKSALFKDSKVVTCSGPDQLSPVVLSSYGYLFVTTECEQFIPNSEFERVWTTDQLVEAHSSHGMSYYRRAKRQSDPPAS